MLLLEVPRGARPAFRNLASTSPLGRLTGIAQTREWLDSLEADYIDRALRAGVCWEEIGAALGLTARRVRDRRRT
jgi:hypothetical protein